MKQQILIAVLTAFLSTSIWAQPPTEKTFAGELPVGVSDMLDKLSSGGVGHVFIEKTCDNKHSNKTCDDLANLKNISTYYGFV